MSNLAISKIKDLESSAERAADLLATMSNKHRLLILCWLVEGEVHAGALADESGLSQSALSQHLAILRRERIVSARKHAQSVSYSLAGDEATKVMESLHDVFCGAASDEE